MTRPVSADLVTSTWTGTVSTEYWEPDNWDNYLIPFNDYWDDYIANITGSASVIFDVPTAIQLYGLNMASGTSLTVYPDTSLTVQNSGNLYGQLTVDAAEFTGMSYGDFLLSNTARFTVTGGSQVTVPARSMSTSGLGAGINWMAVNTTVILSWCQIQAAD